ncbi:MAG: hypothetical protein KTR31_37950 [Myxococcales bacterium]|nr:hypothetical protein [Myxococcales bacterium]
MTAPDSGVRLHGTERDIAVLSALVQAAPELLAAPWRAHAHDDGCVITTDGLAAADVQQRLTDHHVPLEPVPASPPRSAAHLVEAVAPVALPGDPACPVGRFWVRADAPAARDTLERLLRLGRDDAMVATVMHDGHPHLLVEVETPPPYLLMRAREEPQEGVRVFGGSGDGVFVEWGWQHPLPTTVAARATQLGASVLVTREGRWHTLPPELSLGTVYDVLSPVLVAPRQPLEQVAGTHRFTVHVQLGPDAPAAPEAWLVDRDTFAELPMVLHAATPEQVNALRVSRLHGPDNVVHYLLRERRLPGVTPLAQRISDVLDVPGFAPAPGVDTLLLPVGRQLVPPMRRDDVRQMLHLDTLALALVVEGAGGPWVAQVSELHEEPITAWIDLVALDHRVELDRLTELALWSFDQVDIAEPPKPPRPASVPKPPKPRPERPAPRRSRPTPDVDATHTAEPDVDRMALVEAARPLEDRIAEGGTADPTVWAELAPLQEALGSWVDAALCREAAQFYADGVAEGLVASRRHSVDPELRDRDLLELAIEESPGVATASLLGARVLETLASQPLPDGVHTTVVELFSDPVLPVSRRLAWSVLRACHDATDDTLGLTRAREALLGGINAHGLHQVNDVPRFVRMALAFEGTDTPQHDTATHLGMLHELHSSCRSGDPEMEAFRDAIFGAGLLKLGDPEHARDCFDQARTVPLDDVAEGLLQLYLARTLVDPAEARETWQTEMERVTAGLSTRGRRTLLWFCKRSSWLSTPTPTPAEPLRRQAEALAAAVEDEPERAPDTVRAAMTLAEIYEYEVAGIVERCARVVQATGSEEHMAALADAVRSFGRAARRGGGLRNFESPKYAARILGCAMQTAAMAEDRDTVVALLDHITALATRSPLVMEILVAVRPTLLALRRLGLPDEGRHFLLAMEPVTQSVSTGAVELMAALAEGHLQLLDLPRAEATMTRLLDAILAEGLDLVERDRAGAAALSVLRHWPAAERVGHSRRLVDHVDRFRDTFTARTHFPTFKILLLERLVDAVVDVETIGSDRVRTFLDAEELSIRRQIHADWNARCGR